MKYSASPGKRNIRFSLFKTLLVMKFLILFLLVNALHANAHIYGQNVTVQAQNTELKKILYQIEKSTDVRFLYNYNLQSLLKEKKDFAVTNVPLKTALDKLFNKANLTYKVLANNLVVILPSGIADYKAITITGKVTSQDGQPLAGVTVKVKGSNNGTYTDANGNFSINAEEGEVLVVSYVGLEDQEISVGKQTFLNIKMGLAEKQLDQVVVIGYGTARRRDVTSSLNVVSAKEAGANTSTSPAQLLQGKAAGVQVVNNSGVPGSGAQIIIRGTGSFTGVDPLYVIDGIQGDGNLFNTLSAQDIDNITVLKDASATAIYGASGANGVVIVTTKRARGGAPRITYTSQYGVAKAWRTLDLLKGKGLCGPCKRCSGG
jgi:TonB-dependent SusC/RagA subfamily outer membrane receptor